MKHSFNLGLAVLATAVIIPLAGGSPGLARLQTMGGEIAQQVLRPEVRLILQAEKQIQTVDEQGQPLVQWQPLEGTARVQPQDVLRYTITSENAGAVPAKNLLITQVVPPQTTYVLATAVGNDGAAITYSIDGGQSFVAEPKVEVVQPDGTVTLEPAPAEAYTAIRWDFAQALAPEVAVQVSYDLVVE